MLTYNHQRLAKVLASFPVPLFSAQEGARATRGEEKRRAWYTLFAHAPKSLGILRLRVMSGNFWILFVILWAWFHYSYLKTMATCEVSFSSAIAFSFEKLGLRDVSLKAEQRSAIKAIYE